MTLRWVTALPLILGSWTLAAPVLADPLAGSEWGPVRVGETDARDAVDQFIRFEDEGQVAGNGGCNRFTGSYELDGDQLTIGPVAATRMACPELPTALEQAFFQAFDQVATYRRDGLDMFWFNADGTELARLIQRDWD